jgi:Domain of unknown function (DUF4397)
MSLASFNSRLLSASQCRVIALAAVAIVAAACDDATGASRDDASVRVAHGSPDAGAFEVLLNGRPSMAMSNVDFGESTGCFRVDADNPRLTFRQSATGATIPGPESFNLVPRGRHIVVVWGPSTNLHFTALTDLPDAPVLEPGRARVRVFNGTAIPGRLYVYATAMNVAQPQQALVDSVVPGGYTRYVNIPAGAVGLQVNEGAAANVLDALNVLVPSGRELTVMAVDPAPGTTGLRWVLAEMCPAP